ncbi:ribonuclease Z [Elizabethkingia meningoseptica]|uniref:Ribonuclease Z n=1 Tax=Elizabethkingia meningoseptica TaxID=238 RepID=A0A1V3U196_ELIME|nr:MULTISPECIES: ribonuclease Z [Elizabethkingia]AQX13446.1 ribonuclease Z [Elizabethkingia meningoseptica]MBG0515085.1 ribonuclease Z [Elizabethkingia meningoseptica]MDE5434415.1 ribonuclease Z [Elizabethkingia meningoseptica]MDE5448213.1 ribonuclease Z [Elizabethkingia meningoseptica]MDE5470756.1 ribonuclease Z [Elizabethkingia meningoseptica]
MGAYLTILGYNSAIPTTKSSPTAQFLEMDERYFLIDCGEGTQVQLRKAKAKFSKINHIFISHLHGDHCFGLPGLIASFRLLGRDQDLHVYGPKGIKKMLETIFDITETHRGFGVVYHELEGNESHIVYEDDKLEVWTIPLDHRIYCNGYLFREKPKDRRLNMAEIVKYPEIEICDYHNLKRGKDFVLSDGYTLKNEILTTDPEPPVSYAFCSDTRFKEDIIPIIQNVDLLYHESTFLHDLKEMADYTGHTTAQEAAIIAQRANVKKLILGHFSNRYADLTVFTDEAREYFPNTFLPIALEAVKI